VVAYAAGLPDRAEFLTLVCGVAAAPVVAALASVLSGECIARGAPVVPIAVQAMRSLLPAVALLVWPTGPLLLFAALLPAGEAVRALVLRAACRRLRARQAGPPTGELTAYGLGAQAVSSGVTQLGPAVDRLYLSSAGAGAISSYEMSDRLMYAASQLYTMTFIYRRVAIWAQLPTMDAERARRLLRGDAGSEGWPCCSPRPGPAPAWPRWRPACCPPTGRPASGGGRWSCCRCPPTCSTWSALGCW
jgi:hypothetical protein